MAATMTPMPNKPNSTTPLFITQITLPTGTTYELVDQAVREEMTSAYTTINSISSNVNSLSSNLDSVSATVDSLSSTVNTISSTINDLTKYTEYLGVTTTTLEDNVTTNPVVTIGTSSVTASKGSIVINGSKEFIYDGTKWQLFGDLSSLGSLAYKSSISASYVKFKTTTSTSKTVTSSGSFTPSGGVSVSSTKTVYIKMSTTSTTPSNTANYWVYKPEGGVSVTYWGVSTSANFVDNITAAVMIKSITINTPTSATVNNSVNYTSVSDHNLKLCYLVAPTGDSVTYSTKKAYTSTAAIKTTTCEFSGTTVFSASSSIEIPETFSFAGSAGTVSVTSTAKFIDTVTSTTEDAYATITYNN